jgi:hypothetical protein
MNNENDTKFTQDLQRIENEMKSRYGDDGTKDICKVLGRAGGIPKPVMEGVLQTADPADTLRRASNELLLQESYGGNLESEMKFRQIRQQQREAWRKLKGRS